jgi:hypothetical protein
VNNNDNNNKNTTVLCIEMQRMWNMKCMIIPAVIGAIGIVTKGLKKNL